MSDPGILDPLTRWRLVLGEASDGACRAAGGQMSADAIAMDAALDWLEAVTNIW